MAKGNPKIELRLDAATRARWEAVAKADGVSLSEWIRQAAEDRIARASKAPAFVDVIAERGSKASIGGKVFRGPDPKAKGKPK